MACPLSLEYNTDFQDSIGYFYTLDVYHELLVQSDYPTEPRTRKPFRGGIVPHKDFDKYNDYILAATYFEGKRVTYNIGLFYYILYKQCESKQWMDPNVVDLLKKYIFRRISETVCRIGLSNLPLDPDEKVLLPTALWYCIELSSYLFMNDESNFHQERLRMFYGSVHHMIKILEYFEYDLDKSFITNRVNIIRTLSRLKHIPKDNLKVLDILKKVFKQDSNGYLVSEIEKPENIKLLNLLKVKHNEIISENILQEKINLSDYVHLMYHIEKDVDIKICKETLRPCFFVGDNSYYISLRDSLKLVSLSEDNKVEYTNIFSLNLKNVLSVSKFYIEFVQKYKKYPTLSEYIEFINKRKSFTNDRVTIFSTNTTDHINKIFNLYTEFNTMAVEEFYRTSSKSRDRAERIKVENIREFQNDEQIKEFLKAEEDKVKLCCE